MRIAWMVISVLVAGANAEGYSSSQKAESSSGGNDSLSDSCGMWKNAYRCRARYYDSRLKRFLTVDPIGIEGEMNLFAYCADDPVNLVDPFGLAVIVNNTGRPITVTGNPGQGRGSGAQVTATIPAGQSSVWNTGQQINRDNQQYGGANPIATSQGPIYDVDFVEGIKVPGNQYFPVYYVNEGIDSATGQRQVYVVIDPIGTVGGMIRTILNPGSVSHQPSPQPGPSTPTQPQK